MFGNNENMMANMNNQNNVMVKMQNMNYAKGIMEAFKNKDYNKMASLIMENNNNPLVSGFAQMVKEKRDKDIEEFARNLCKEKNIDFDAKFNNFMNNFQNILK